MQKIVLHPSSTALNPGSRKKRIKQSPLFHAVDHLVHDRLAEAIVAYKEVIALAPHLADAHYGFGFALLRLGRYAEALARFDQAILLQPDHATAYVARGKALNALGRHHEALESFERAITLKPDYPAAHQHRGVAREHLGLSDEAICFTSTHHCCDEE